MARIVGRAWHDGVGFTLRLSAAAVLTVCRSDGPSFTLIQITSTWPLTLREWGDSQICGRSVFEPVILTVAWRVPQDHSCLNPSRNAKFRRGEPSTSNVPVGGFSMCGDCFPTLTSPLFIPQARKCHGEKHTCRAREGHVCSAVIVAPQSLQSGAYRGAGVDLNRFLPVKRSAIHTKGEGFPAPLTAMLPLTG